MTRKELKELLALTEVDTELSELTARVQRIEAHPQIRALEREIAAVQDHLSKLRERQRELERKIRWQEMETEELVRERKKLADRLYSGRGNPKELEQMQKKIELLKNQQETRETETLELMEASEEIRKQIEVRNEDLSKKEGRLGRFREEVSREIGLLSERISRLREKRDNLALRVETSLLKEYDYMRSRIGDPAMAPVKDGICGGCSVSLPIILANRVKKGEALQRCENCGRLLCWVD